MNYKCRVVSEQFRAHEWGEFTMDNIFYSAKLPLKEADALVVLYDPCEDLLAFQGPKLWFTMEPSWHHHFKKNKIGRKLIKTLDASQHIFYNNPESRYRIPHPTYSRELTTVRQFSPKVAAVAVVSNFGGRFWFLKPHIWLRNKFILSPLVELYGNPASWLEFQKPATPWLKGPPKNFQGKVLENNSLELFSKYKVAVCLENCTETNYFTEKFVNAVRAGCIPVYHAHPSVKKLYLNGARWVDPIDFGFSPSKTIRFALQQNLEEYREANDAWLNSGILKETDSHNTFGKLHDILKVKLLKSE